MKEEVTRESALAEDVLMLYNFLPSYFQAKQGRDFKIKACERGAGEKRRQHPPTYLTYAAPVSTEIFFFFPQIGKRS